jgi:subtilisin family serine protease
MKNLFILVLLLTMPLVSMASRVSVVDSGTDFAHELLKANALINSGEVVGNRVDDDKNGKVDDIMGWNFVDDYGRVFFREHLSSIDEKVFKYFEVISRIQSGKPTAEDAAFWKANMTDLNEEQKQAVKAQLNFYGQYSHSTHVSGIVVSLSPKAKIMSSRVFPDTPPNAQPSTQSGLATLGVADIFYKLIGAINNGSFHKVGAYLNEKNIDVANYSLGVNLSMIAKLTLGLRGVKEPTAQQLSKETLKVSAQFLPQGQKWMASAPKTLFVVAAGNDGTNNDLLPVFPASVKAPNLITVAATQGYDQLARFSNYGQSVDIAAPGVAIVSSVPSLNNQQMLPMSGTSMAAPYITGVAAKIKDLNPSLSAADIKQILMSTVDKKDWLKEKVKSAGIVNPARAYLAAEKTKSMTLAEATSAARESVADIASSGTSKSEKDFVFEDRSADQFVF